MKKRLAGMVLIVLLSGCSPFQEKGPSVSPFTFVNQHGESFGFDELEGKVWIADFIFTNCETVCPPMTSTLSDLQETLKEEGLEAEFVSFSVDPEVDSPERLKGYLSAFTEEDANWNLLTGYTQEQIEKFALDEFQTLVSKPDETDQVLHGVNFYVVNPEGVIVEEVSFTDSDVTEKIVKEVKRHQ
ncbi:SCO family protein [Jeotgalibacillus proteolyticus]|uniref:SCO family protein n=1 Tax=Jeotgalibacillus proteolyticus TaxID=2082395 RepID=UPI003CEF5ECF